MPPRRCRNPRKTAGSTSRPLPRQQQQQEPRGEEAPPHTDQTEEAMEIDNQTQQQNPTGQSSNGESMDVDLDLVEKYLKCPICLGIRRQSRIVKDCLHRFCKECIDTALRLGNHECPVCRRHLASKRSLVEDIRSDRVIACLYKHINLSIHDDVKLNDEERYRNEQIQESFAQTLQRQKESLRKRRTIPSVTLSSSRRRSLGRGRRGRQIRTFNTNIEGLSDNDEDVNCRESFSSDQFLSPTDSGLELSNGDADKYDEALVNREASGLHQESSGTSNVPSWGRSGQRSKIGRDKGCCSSSVQVEGIGELENNLDRLQIDTTNNDELEIYGEDGELGINVALINSNSQTLPTLEQPYISCPLTYSVKQLRQHVAYETGAQLKEVELLLLTDPAFPLSGCLPVYDRFPDNSRLLMAQEILQELQSNCTAEHVLVIGYRRPVGMFLRQTRQNIISFYLSFVLDILIYLAGVQKMWHTLYA